MSLVPHYINQHTYRSNLSYFYASIGVSVPVGRTISCGSCSLCTGITLGRFHRVTLSGRPYLTADIILTGVRNNESSLSAEAVLDYIPAVGRGAVIEAGLKQVTETLTYSSLRATA